MQKKKVCMVGEFAVGKTSLTQRFVNNIFSDKYLTTVGVKIDVASVDDTKLVVWDIAGRDSLSPLNANYLVGAAAVVLVADGTRASTVDALPDLKKTVEQRIGSVPMIIAINKHDNSNWLLSDEQSQKLAGMGVQSMNTSAKEGENVDLIFNQLVSMF